MEKTYLFYDIETTGLNPCFDQIVQFAALRTDLELNELERHEFLVKLNPDIVPAPKALATHQLTPEVLAAGLCEYEAITQIHKLVNQPGTISLGYNTLRFDDEFLRFSFYRNLLAPYTHQWAADCGRMDLYPLTVMYYLYRPEVLQWPEQEGKPSLSLENLNIANKLAAGNAHNAMVDVAVTLELARIFIKERKMWDYLLSYFNKNQDLARLSKLTEAVVADGGFGSSNNYQAYVVALGVHNHYKNQSLWLRLDYNDLTSLRLANIPENSYVVRKKAADIYLFLPPNEKYINTLTEKQRALVVKNKRWLENNAELFSAITHYHREYKYPEVENVDIDAALYRVGFPTPEEEALRRKFHATPVAEKFALLEEFANPNLRQQALRILARNYPQYLPQEYLEEFQAEMARSDIVDYKGNLKNLIPG